MKKICDNDLKRQMRKYYANANILLRKFSSCSPDVKCCMHILLHTYCATMYCPSMWFDSTVTNMKKLKIAYNNGRWRLLNLPNTLLINYITEKKAILFLLISTYKVSPSEMFVNSNIPSFGELLRKFAFVMLHCFKSRIMISDNLLVLVNGIVRSATPLIVFSKIWALWSDILNMSLFTIISVYMCWD